MSKTNLKDVLQELMQHNGRMAESQLAKEYGIPQSTINRMLRGTTQLPHRKRFLRVNS